jgi:hypothetical protein
VGKATVEVGEEIIITYKWMKAFRVQFKEDFKIFMEEAYSEAYVSAVENDNANPPSSRCSRGRSFLTIEAKGQEWVGNSVDSGRG